MNARHHQRVTTRESAPGPCRSSHGASLYAICSTGRSTPFSSGRSRSLAVPPAGRRITPGVMMLADPHESNHPADVARLPPAGRAAPDPSTAPSAAMLLARHCATATARDNAAPRRGCPWAKVAMSTSTALQHKRRGARGARSMVKLFKFQGWTFAGHPFIRCTTCTRPVLCWSKCGAYAQSCEKVSKGSQLGWQHPEMGGQIQRTLPQRTFHGKGQMES